MRLVGRSTRREALLQRPHQAPYYVQQMFARYDGRSRRSCAGLSPARPTAHVYCLQLSSDRAAGAGCSKARSDHDGRAPETAGNKRKRNTPKRDSWTPRPQPDWTTTSTKNTEQNTIVCGCAHWRRGIPRVPTLLRYLSFTVRAGRLPYNTNRT